MSITTKEHRKNIQTGWQDISMLPSIFLAAWHVYLVFQVSLEQYCAYAYRMMKVQKQVPGGSCTYSTSALKWCQGGPHLQSNLTTKVKNTLQLQTKFEWCQLLLHGSLREFKRGIFQVLCVCVCSWHGLFVDRALHQCNVMIALARKEGLIYMRGSPRSPQEHAFDQDANKPAEKQCNYNLQTALFRPTSIYKAEAK